MQVRKKMEMRMWNIQEGWNANVCQLSCTAKTGFQNENVMENGSIFKMDCFSFYTCAHQDGEWLQTVLSCMCEFALTDCSWPWKLH